MRFSGPAHASKSPTVSADKATRTGGPTIDPIGGRDRPLTTGRIIRLVQFHVRDDPPKTIARRLAERADFEVNAETTRNWRRGRNAPDVIGFLALCRAYPALAKDAERLIAMEADQSPEFSRALSAFVAAWQAMKR